METKNWAVSAFKFQNQKNVDRLLEQGNVYIPNMKIFADRSRFSGDIYDDEGALELTNIYESVVLPSEKVFGLASSSWVPGYHRTYTVTKYFRAVPQNLYCFASYFFSDTLLFSVKEGKDACVFIIDINKFHQTVDANIDFAALALVGKCKYVGRNIVEHNPGQSSFSHCFINGKIYNGELEKGKFNLDANPLELSQYLYLIKPQEHYNQYEIRSIWIRTDGKNDDINVYIPEVKKLCVEVKFKEIYNALKSGVQYSDLRTNVKINYAGGKSQTVYRHLYAGSKMTPEPMFNPVVCYSEQGKMQLYFRLRTPNINIPHVLFEGIEIHMGISGSDIGPFEMDGIESIEYTIAE